MTFWPLIMLITVTVLGWTQFQLNLCFDKLLIKRGPGPGQISIYYTFSRYKYVQEMFLFFTFQECETLNSVHQSRDHPKVFKSREGLI